MENSERQPLSEREKEILALLATGATNQEIARALYISPNTVKVHLRNIYTKLQVMNRSEAILVGLQEGLITLPGVDRNTPPPTPPPMPVGTPHLRWFLALSLVIGSVVLILLLLWPWEQGNAWNARAPLPISDIGRGEKTLPTRRPVARWNPLTPMGTPLSRMAVTTWQNRIFIFGGESPTRITGSTRIYDPERGVWARGASKPTPVSNAHAALVDDRVYVFGGTRTDFHPTDTVEIYDPVADEWSTGSPMPHPTAGYALATWHQRVFLFGGWDGDQYLTAVYMYVPQEDRWVALPPLRTPRAFATAATFEDRIYVIGGYDGQTDMAEVWTFDPRALDRGENPWVQVQSLLTPRGGAGVAVVANAIYVIGGGITLPVEGAERYDVTTDTWARVDVPYGPNWRNMGTAVLAGDILTFGGWAGAHLPFVERYQASFRNFIPYGPVNNE